MNDNQILSNGKLNTSLTDFEFNFESMEIMYDLINQFMAYNPYPNLEMIFETDTGGNNTECYYTVCKFFAGNKESHFISFLFNYLDGIKDFENYVTVIKPRIDLIDETLEDLKNNPIK